MRSLCPFAFALAVLVPVSAPAQILPFNEAGITLGHVHLNVTDPDAMKKFFVEQFDAKPLASDKLAGVKVPGMLILFTKKEPTGGSEGTALDHFGFRVHSLQEMTASLTAAGYTVGKPFKGSEGFPNAYVTGPDHIKIEMQEDVNQPVKAIVNHLHFMVKDPMALRAWYIEKMGMTETTRGTLKTANAGQENLSFGASKEDTLPTRGRTIDHAGFEVKNLEAYCRKLEGEGIKLDVPYRKVPALGIAVAFLTDPTGVYIELTEGLGAY